jgi:protocatechuate 3,4-dioxygenase beta subunit
MNATQGSISGRVLDAAGLPIAGASVAVSGGSQQHRDIGALTSADGRFRFGNMLPGAYQVSARARNATRAVDVVVSPGQTADAEIRLNV